VTTGVRFADMKLMLICTIPRPQNKTCDNLFGASSMQVARSRSPNAQQRYYQSSRGDTVARAHLRVHPATLFGSVIKSAHYPILVVPPLAGLSGLVRQGVPCVR
jgi:hypothetical protein